MNKPTSLFTAPPFSPLIQKNRRCSCKRHIAVLQSLIKCNDWVIEKIYSSITLQCWLHEACGFWKKKVASQREKERDKEKEKEREREYFHWVTQRAFCQTSWADLQRWWRKRLSRRKGWAGEGRQAEVRSHVHHHLFVYIETADHLETDGDTLLIKCCYRQKGATVKNKYNQWWLNSI